MLDLKKFEYVMACLLHKAKNELAKDMNVNAKNKKLINMNKVLKRGSEKNEENFNSLLA